jgi:capsular exopolysaccharide synthesis family protein
MSRIFDALQRSGVEQVGVEYPDVISVITEVFESSKEALPDAPQPISEEPEAVLSALHLPVEHPITKKPLPTPPQPILQQPEADLSTIDLPVDHLVTKKPSTRPKPILQEPEVDLSALQLPEHSVTKKPASQELYELPMLNVSVPSSSRLVVLTEPDSFAAEKFRFLGVRLRHIQQTRSLKKVLVTSTIPAEGKSFVSVNLAGVLARRKQKVLLIEGDLRRPTLSKVLGLGKLVGLGEWLQGDRRRLANIFRLEGPDFWFMPAGDPPANPLELMQSGRLSQLMEQLSAMFDWIIVDSPPLLPLADTTVWARVTDGALLVAREGKTEKALLRRGLEVVKKSELLGVVINGCTQPIHNYYNYAAPANG